jgi:hypothetical protein
MTLPFLVCACVTAISAVVSLGFSIAAVLAADGEAWTMALYACARSLALVAVSAAPFFTGSVSWLLAIASAMTIVQACDTAVGVKIKDTMKTFGPAVTALVNAAAAIWLIAQ